MPKLPKRKNASSPAPLTHLDSERHKLPSSEVDLTAAERRMLEDPNSISEDEADAILSLRIDKEEGAAAIPFREYLKRRGRRVEN